MGWDRVLAILVVLVVVGVLALVAYVAIVAIIPAKVDMKLSRDSSGRPTIVLAPNWRVNAIHYVAFWMDGDQTVLWKVESRNDSTNPLTQVVYGQVPVGSIQTFPSAEVAPRPIPNGAVFYIEVGYQWDSNIPPAACGGTRTVQARLLEDGRVENLGDSLPGAGLRK